MSEAVQVFVHFKIHSGAIYTGIPSITFDIVDVTAASMM
jgi:hypothetical protein